MKKSTAITLTSGLVLLLAAGKYILADQSHTKPISYQTTQSKAKQATTSHDQATVQPSHNDTTQTTSLRSDLVNTPAENEVTQDLMVAGEDILNTRQLSSQTSSLDFTSLSLGDFSSLSGTWVDANGYTLTFSPQGLVSHDGSLSMSTLVYDANGEALSHVNVTNGHGSGGFNLHYYPAGIEIPAWHFGITSSDPSDFGRDRLFASQISRFDYESTTQFINSVFYKISDNYPTENLTTETIESSSAIDSQITQEIQEKSLTEIPQSSPESHTETQ